MESSNDKIKRTIRKEGFFTEENYAFVIMPKFSTLASIIEIEPKLIDSQISFVQDDSIRGFDPVVIYETYILSPHPVDISCFDKIFLETYSAQGMIFKGKRSGINLNFSMDVDPVYICIHCKTLWRLSMVI